MLVPKDAKDEKKSPEEKVEEKKTTEILPEEAKKPGTEKKLVNVDRNQVKALFSSKIRPSRRSTANIRKKKGRSTKKQS